MEEDIEMWDWNSDPLEDFNESLKQYDLISPIVKAIF